MNASSLDLTGTCASNAIKIAAHADATRASPRWPRHLSKFDDGGRACEDAAAHAVAFRWVSTVETRVVPTAQ